MRLVVLLPILLAGCASSPPPYLDLASYACSDGTTLRVQYSTDGAHVTLPDNSVLILPQQPTGMRFAAGPYELRPKDGDATWTAAPHALVACRGLDRR